MAEGLNKKPRLRVFLLRALLLSTVIVLVIQTVAGRYRLGIDSQIIRCLPHRYYLIDLQDKQLIPGKLYAFSARGTQPFFIDGTWLVKRLVAGPGDSVAIAADTEQLTVNGRLVARGLPISSKLGVPAAQFAGKRQLQPGEYWFLGDNSGSFDSRYWGVVKDEQIIGRAKALF